MSALDSGRALVQAIVETARAIFAAAASSVFLLDAQEPVILDEVAGDPRFGREHRVCALDADGGAAPPRERALGVLEVLDRRERSRTPLEDGAARAVRAVGRDRARPAHGLTSADVPGRRGGASRRAPEAARPASGRAAEGSASAAGGAARAGGP